MIDLDYERAFDAWPAPPTQSESDAIDAATALAMEEMVAREIQKTIALHRLPGERPGAA